MQVETSKIGSGTLPAQSGACIHSFGPPLGASWIDDEIRELQDEFERYMIARQCTNHLSESTRRRYLPERLIGKRAPGKVEQEFSHRMVAAHYTYQRQALLCAKAGADFAAALMSMSATECLLLIAFLDLKQLVRETPEYRRVVKNAARQKAKNRPVLQKQAKRSFQDFMASLRIEEQFKIAFQVRLLTDEDVSFEIAQVLSSYKLKGPAGLLNFLKDSRNQLHTRKFVAAVDDYALALDVIYNADKMAQFHRDFALCSYHFMAAVNANLDKLQKHLQATKG